MDILLRKLDTKDAEGLFQFELENRTFFETMVPTRGDDYYNFEFFKERHKALLDEQNQEGSYFYLIKDQMGSILGRMNLIDIDKTQNLGHVGYRVGERYIGKGIANNALKLLLEIVSKKGIEKIKAKTTDNNKASQRVLEKNGFKREGTGDEEFDGQKLKFVYYTWSK